MTDERNLQCKAVIEANEQQKHYVNNHIMSIIAEVSSS